MMLFAIWSNKKCDEFFCHSQVLGHSTESTLNWNGHDLVTFISQRSSGQTLPYSLYIEEDKQAGSIGGKLQMRYFL